MNKTFTPQYIRIRNDIINRINNGELKKDDRLPPEREIAEQFGVSRITVVGALHDLKEQGIVRKVRGSGSYINVSHAELDDPGEIFSGFLSPARITIRHGLLICPAQMLFVMRTLAALFRMENPDIKVDVELLNPQGFIGTEDPYLSLIGEGRPPATGEFYFHSDYSALNALYPLEDMPGFDKLRSSLIEDAVMPTLDMENRPHIHALALRLNTKLCIVNQAFLKRAGIRELPEKLTSELLDDWCPRLGAYAKKHPGNYGVIMPLPFGWHNVIGYFPYLWGDARGLDVSAASFMKVLKSRSCLDGLRSLARWYRDGYAAPPEDDELFYFGRAGLSFESPGLPWDSGNMLRRIGDYRIYPMPAPRGMTQSVSMLGNFSIGIFKGGVKNDEELEAAWKWVKFLFQKRTQYPLSLTYDFPARLQSKSRLNELPDEIRTPVFDAIHHAQPQFDFKNIRLALTVFGRELRRCIRGEISPEACIDSAWKRLQDIVAV